MSQNLNNQKQRGVSDFAPAISIDPKALLYRIRKGWYWFVLSLLIIGVAAWLQVRYTSPRYATSATFIIEDPSKSGGVSPQEFTRQFGFIEESSLDDELNVLTSRSIMVEVVKSLGLQLSVSHIGEVRNTVIYQPKNHRVVSLDTSLIANDEIKFGSVELLRAKNNQYYLVDNADTVRYTSGSEFNIGNRRFAVLINPVPDKVQDEETSWLISHIDPQSLAASMQKRLSAAKKGSSNTVSIYYTDNNAQRAADVVNELISIYNRQIIDQRSKMGAQTLTFIDERLRFVTRELNRVESSLSGLREQENLAVDNSSRGTDYLTQLNAADAQLSELEVRRSLIEQLQNELSTGEYKPISIVSEIIDGSLSQLVSRYNEVIFEREQRLETATAENPYVSTYSEQLNDLKQSLVRSLNTLYRETTERISRVEQRIRPIEEEIRKIPDEERRLLQILRQQQIKQNLFIYLMEKREEAAITVAAQVPNTRVIDPARPNTNPIFPKPNQNYFGAFALGLLIPGMYFFLREAFSTKIQLEKEVLRRTDRTVIGRIATTADKSGLVISSKNRSGIAELFRMLRTNLSFLLKPNSPSVVLFTSAVSGEGKTFIASNLAASLALAGRRTIIVGADMRKPRLFEIFTENGDEKHSRQLPGLSNYLIEEADYESIIQASNVENLSVIECGPIPPDPSELLLRPHITELFDRLRQDYDHIIIDAPPIGLVTDAQQLATYVDLSVYVIRLGYTPKTSIDVLNEAADKGRLPNLNVVLNGLQPKRDYGYGHSKGYYK